MADRPVLAIAFAVVVLGAVAAVFVQSGLVYTVFPPSPDGYERATVTTYDENGTQLATVEVRIADTRGKQYLGLSATDELGPNEGMLFVHDEEDTRGYVMRNMSFPLDIVFVGSDERVTRIYHAPVPDGEYDRSYSGRGKWVLEVPRGWTNRTGLDVGDRVAVPPSSLDRLADSRDICSHPVMCGSVRTGPGSTTVEAVVFAGFGRDENVSAVENTPHVADGLLKVQSVRVPDECRPRRG